MAQLGTSAGAVCRIKSLHRFAANCAAGAIAEEFRSAAYGTGSIRVHYSSMSLDRAREYRFEARKCFEQADRTPSDMVKARMKEIAEAWLKMAANAEAEIGAPRHD